MFSRYLLQVMLEACCLEWGLLLAIILRDAMAVIRTVNTASLTETPIEIVGRMREGISYLELWADTEWYVLRTFSECWWFILFVSRSTSRKMLCRKSTSQFC